MGEVAKAGRTVLFVSHNMAAVQSLCSRAVWLRGGTVERIGDAPSVISEYLRQSIVHEGERAWTDIASAPGNEWIRLHAGRIRPAGPASEELSVRTPFAIEIEYWNVHDNQRLALSINLYNEQGALIFSAGPPHEQVFGGRPMPAALFRDSCQVPGDLLNDGLHRAELYVMRGSDVIYHDADFLSFTLSDSADLRGSWFGKWPGAIRPNLQWGTELIHPLVDVTQPSAPAPRS
jgi:lipopolysaccharide transport system ATP-binding protein